MKDLVEVIAKALVDHPDEVVVTEKEDGRNVVVELHVAASDMGKSYVLPRQIWERSSESRAGLQRQYGLW